MGQKIDWRNVGALIAEVKALGLTYKEGAKKAGVSVWRLYDYNRWRKKQGAGPGHEDEQGAKPPRKAVPQESGQPSDPHGRAEDIARSGPSTESLDGSKPQAEVSKSAPEVAGLGRGRKRVQLPDEVVDLIVGYKKENPSHGFKRIEDWLKSKYLVVVPRKRIRAVLKERGLLEDGDSSFDRMPEEKKGERRFEALYPRQLWQMDHTNVYIEGMSVLYLVLVEDDYSRFCVGASLEHGYDGETMIGVLHNAASRYGKPEKLLTDQGPAFYTWSMGRTRFEHYLDEMRIEHLVSEPHSPQTLGKIERLNQTIKKELIGKVRFKSYEDACKEVARFITYYNYERPHQSLGGARPSDRFFGLVGEKARVEGELTGQGVDLSRGYLIFNAGGRTVSVASAGERLEVYLDGKLLKEQEDGTHD